MAIMVQHIRKIQSLRRTIDDRAQQMWTRKLVSLKEFYYFREILGEKQI